MSRDRGGQLDPRPTAIRRPTGDTPVARAADTFQTATEPAAPESAAKPAPRRGRPRKAAGTPLHRTTVLYPDATLTALKIAAIQDQTSVGEIVRASLTTALKAPARLAGDAEAFVGIAGARTTLDLDVDQHRRLKVLAAEKGVTVQSLILAALKQAHPDMI